MGTVNFLLHAASADEDVFIVMSVTRPDRRLVGGDAEALQLGYRHSHTMAFPGVSSSLKMLLTYTRIFLMRKTDPFPRSGSVPSYVKEFVDFKLRRNWHIWGLCGLAVGVVHGWV